MRPHTRTGARVHTDTNECIKRDVPLPKCVGSLNNVFLVESTLRHVTTQHRLHLPHLRIQEPPLRVTTSTTSHNRVPSNCSAFPSDRQNRPLK